MFGDRISFALLLYYSSSRPSSRFSTGFQFQLSLSFSTSNLETESVSILIFQEMSEYVLDGKILLPLAVALGVIILGSTSSIRLSPFKRFTDGIQAICARFYLRLFVLRKIDVEKRGDEPSVSGLYMHPSRYFQLPLFIKSEFASDQICHFLT